MTTEILELGVERLGERFIVQHNAIGRMPQEQESGLCPEKLASYLGISQYNLNDCRCPNEDEHPAVPAHLNLAPDDIDTGLKLHHYPQAASGCPNRWVLYHGARGQVTAFQTPNRQKVDTPEDVDSTLENAERNSDAILVELYESLIWEIERKNDGILDSTPKGSGRTLAEWDDLFNDRSPRPMTHSHTFSWIAGASTASETFSYVHPSKCATGGGVATITVLPPRHLTSWSRTIDEAEVRFRPERDGFGIRDVETQLVWQASPTADAMTWADAIHHCLNRNTGGRKGWRLPRVEELASLLVFDPQIEGLNGTLPVGHPFTTLVTSGDAVYWSSTPDPVDPANAYAQGFRDAGVSGKRDRNEENHVFCVASGQG